MDAGWENFIKVVGGILTTVATVLGGWYLKIRSRNVKIREEEAKTKRADAEAAAAIEQQKLAASQALKKAERNDVNEEAWVLIRRLQEIIKEHADELAKLKAEYESCLTACESRERELASYIAKLEKEYGRTVERIRFYEARLSQIKGWNIPPFEEEAIERGSATHQPLNQSPAKEQ